MKKLLIIFGIVVLFITIIRLSGCTSTPSDIDKNRFVGTWKKQDTLQNLTFFSNGTVPDYIPGVTGNWLIKDGNIVISISISQVTFDIVYDFSFLNNDKTLMLILIQPKGVGYDYTEGTYTKEWNL
jgi:hypothetical protein